MAGAEEEEGALGPWTGAELEQTARSVAGVGADDGLPKEIRFVANVAKLVRRRTAQEGAAGDPPVPAVFLLCPSPPKMEAPFKPLRIPMLDNGLTTLTGRVWFVSAGPGSGHFTDHNCQNDDELFNLVTDHFGQASTPAIVFDPRTQVPEARFYAQGLVQPDNYEPISIRTEDVTLERVLSIVELIYRNQLVTPAIHSKVAKLWHSSRNSRPSKTAEAKIQLYLKAGLQGAFPTCVVRDEQIMPEGRLDIEIEQADALDPATVTRHAVLELKVLRSVTQGGTTVSDATTADWIRSGVEQAAAYRTSKHFLWCALFCFDMRTSNVGQACFDHVREIAVQLGVAVRCWYLYVSAREYQRARAATG